MMGGGFCSPPLPVGLGRSRDVPDNPTHPSHCHPPPSGHPITTLTPQILITLIAKHFGLSDLTHPHHCFSGSQPLLVVIPQQLIQKVNRLPPKSQRRRRPLMTQNQNPRLHSCVRSQILHKTTIIPSPLTSSKHLPQNICTICVAPPRLKHTAALAQKL